MRSILDSVKKVIGIDKEYKHFDTDILMHINTAFFSLNQLGIGPDAGYRIEGHEEQWDEFLLEREDLEAVKSYIFIKVRLLFDRPETSYGIQALERQAKELEWRLEVQSSKG